MPISGGCADDFESRAGLRDGKRSDTPRTAVSSAWRTRMGASEQVHELGRIAADLVILTVLPEAALEGLSWVNACAVAPDGRQGCRRRVTECSNVWTSRRTRPALPIAATWLLRSCRQRHYRHCRRRVQCHLVSRLSVVEVQTAPRSRQARHSRPPSTPPARPPCRGNR